MLYLTEKNVFSENLKYNLAIQRFDVKGEKNFELENCINSVFRHVNYTIHRNFPDNKGFRYSLQPQFPPEHFPINQCSNRVSYNTDRIGTNNTNNNFSHISINNTNVSIRRYGNNCQKGFNDTK